MLKRILLVVGLLAVLLVGALIAAVLLFDPNDYKDRIARLVTDETGRELRIVDDLHLSVFPWLGIKTGRIEFANARGFGKEPFAQIDGAGVRVRVLPLLSRRIEIDTVTLHGLVLRLETDAQGHTNWDDLAAKSSGAEPEESKPSSAAAPAAALPAALTIGGLELRDAAVYWVDRSAGSKYELTHIELSSGRIEEGNPVDLKLGFDVASAEPALGGHVDFASRITAFIEDQRLDAQGLRLQARMKGAGLPGGAADVSLAGDLAADLRAQTAKVSGLELRAYGVQAGGEIAATGIVDKPQASGRLAISEFDPRRLFASLGTEPPVTADPAVLKRAAAAFTFAADANEARVDGIDIHLDDTRVQGKAAVRSFDNPEIAFDINIDDLDLDRYLPPTTDEVPPASAAGAPAAAALLPVDTLRALNLNGSLAAGRLRATGLVLTDLQLRAQARNGLLRFSPMRAALYGGHYEGETTIDARGDTPRLDISSTVSSVQAKPLLTDMLDFEMLSGTADFTLSAHSEGNTDPELRRALAGKGRFAFRDGAIEGFNAAQMIREAKARLKGGATATNETRATDFTSLTGTFNIDKGVLRNEDLSGSSPYLRIAGAGTADLAAETVDYRLRVRVVDTSAGQGGAGLDEVKGLDVPIRVHGPMSDPSYGLDGDFVKGALSQALDKVTDKQKQELKQRIEDKTREVQEKLQDKMGDKLKGLFK